MCKENMDVIKTKTELMPNPSYDEKECKKCGNNTSTRCQRVCKKGWENKIQEVVTKSNSKYDKDKCQKICGNKANLVKNKVWPKVLATTCDSWGGNSGSAYFSRNTGNLISICSYGKDDFNDSGDTDYALSAVVLKELIEKARKDYPVKTHVVSEPVSQLHDAKVETETVPTPYKSELMSQSDAQQNSQNVIEGTNNTSRPVESVQKLVAVKPETVPTPYKPESISQSDAQQNLQNVINGIDESSNLEFTISKETERVEKIVNSDVISNKDILQIIDGMTTIQKLEEEYKRAKERETSLENRMLGAATMAATGIGGMQLAQGLAEQNADAAAARDMAAYMATFQCRIGDKGGKSYPGGTSNIETPGANQLINTYQEYVALAKDLSERKSALGMKPGIEAEVILDKSATGLYDDVGHGVMGGTYASLYRAAMGSETDKQKLDSDKEASSNRVKGGAIAAGGGAVGGAVGNMLINGGDDDDDADAKSEKNTSAKSSVDWKQVGAAIGNKVDLNKISTAIK
jgi:hypothetical protein